MKNLTIMALRGDEQYHLKIIAQNEVSLCCALSYSIGSGSKYFAFPEYFGIVDKGENLVQ